MEKIVIPVETKVREFIGKVWLGANLADRGYKVAVGKSSSIYDSLDLLQPDVYFTLSAVNHDRRRERLRALQRCGTQIAVLDTEGSAFPGFEQYKERVDPDILSMVDHYFAWGNKSKHAAVTQAGDDFKRKVTVSGNPRFDLLHPGLREVYRQQANDIVSEYGRFILINTNFTVNYAEGSSLSDYIDEGSRELYQKQTQWLGEFISLIATLSRSSLDTDVIIRPHPSEDKDLYEQLFLPFENVSVVRDGSVRPWIMAADVVVHNSCTTAVSSALLNKPVFAYTSDGPAVHESPIPNIVSIRFDNPDDIVQRLRTLETDMKYKMDEGQKQKLKQHIANIDFCSAEKIVDVINSGERTGTERFDAEFDPANKTRLRRKALRTVGQEFLDEYYYSWRRNQNGGYKFDSLSQTEIEETLEQFPKDKIPVDLEIESEQNALDVFWMQTSS